MDKKQTNRQENGQTNRRNYTNFERNLAMMVICIPVKYEFDWTKCFLVGVRKRKCGQTDGWTDKRTTRQMNGRIYTNFERNLAMMVMYVPVKFELDWSNRFRVSQRSKLRFYVPFNSQGHIGTGPQNCHLWDSNPQR